jgi:hypothetical protein
VCCLRVILFAGRSDIISYGIDIRGIQMAVEDEAAQDCQGQISIGRHAVSLYQPVMHRTWKFCTV